MTQLSDSRARELRSVLAGVCAAVGLDPAGARLIKYTNNVVSQLSSSVVVRVGVGDLGIGRAAPVVRLTRWLADRDAPVPRLVADVEQPVVLDGYAATVWEWLPGGDERWTASDLAVPLRRLHSLEVDVAADTATALPNWDPFTAARRRLAAADPLLPVDDRGWLAEQWHQAERAYRDLDIASGVIHGDAHTGNVLRDRTGRVVLCDLDSTGIGPVAWDLAVCAVGAERFGRGDSYTELAAAYGRDVTSEPWWPVLQRIRELVLVTSVVPDLSRRAGIAAEHRRRLSDLRTGRPTGYWHAYH